MKDYPGYGRTRGRGGPRTKKQLRFKREAGLRRLMEQRRLERIEVLLEEKRRGLTLHDIDWKP